MLGDLAVCLLYVTLICSFYITLLRGLNFLPIFSLSNSLGTRTVCVKILERNSKGFWIIVQVKWKGLKMACSINISRYLGNDTIYCHSYSGRRIGARMRSDEWFHFQLP